MFGCRRSRSFVKAAIAISFATCALAACRQLAAIDDKTVADSCGATVERTAQCGECMAIDCCAELAACAADPACARAQGCLARCEATDDRCRSACAETARDGYGDALARVLACRTNACATACSTPCGAGAVSSAECAQCAATSCCEEERACSANPECLTRRWRRERCTESTCRDFGDRIDGGVADDAVLATCLANNACTSSCASWGCVATSVPPKPRGTVSVTIEVHDSPQLRAVVPGLRIRPCERRAMPCITNQEFERETGPGGVATFEDIPFSSTEEAFDGYFEIVDPTGERMPMLLFLEPPVRGLRAVRVPSLTHAARADVESQIGVRSSPLSAILGVHPVDCSGAEGAGVKLSLDVNNDEVPFYFAHEVLTVASPRSSTDTELAFGGFAGVAPGTKTVRGTWAANGAELFATPVYVSPGSFTFVSFTARP